MSRLRKNRPNNLKKPSYSGDFASTFKTGLSTDTPFSMVASMGPNMSVVDLMKSMAKKTAAVKAAAAAKSTAEAAKVTVAASDSGALDEDAKVKALEDGKASDAAKGDVGDKDQVPSDTNYSREEVGAFFQRTKLAEEQVKLDQDKEAKEKADKEAAEAEKEKAGEGDKPGGDPNENSGFENDYDCDMSKGERKAEKKENKSEIKDEKKACIRRGPGGHKSTCGLGKKNKACRKHRKQCRQDKRGGMKENRQMNRATKKCD